MATRNAFNLLSDFTSDDPSVISKHLKVITTPKKPISNPRSKPLSQSTHANQPKKCREKDETTYALESGYRKKFGVSEDGEFEKEVSDTMQGRCNGGLKRSFFSNSRLLCRPGRELVDQEAEDFLVRVSAKYRIYDRRSVAGRSVAKKKAAGKREGSGRGNWGRMGECEFADFGNSDVEELEEQMRLEDERFTGWSEDDEPEDKMTLKQYGMLVNEKKKALQTVLLEHAAKLKEEEDLINGFVIVDAADLEDYQLL